MIKEFFAHHKSKIIVFVALAAAYFLFHYLPLEHWMGEVPYLILKICFYALLGGLLIFFKKCIHIHIEDPNKEISLLWILPLLLICFVDFIYVWAFHDSFEFHEIEPVVLVMEVVGDLFLSVVEDILFIDLGIELFAELYKKTKCKYFLAILTQAILFTVAHCYTFMRYPMDVSIVILVSVFFLVFECGYLAVYFESPLIPIIAHCLFNEMNFVVFFQVFDLKINDSYVIFTILVLSLTSCYLAACYRMSTLQQKINQLSEDVIVEE